MIELSGLVKTYGDRRAVDELSVDVRPGRVTGFLGPNGAGKSTTLRLLLGLDHPDRGSAHIFGRPYSELPDPLRVVGAHLDGRAVHPGRTARAHLLGLARYNRIPSVRVDEVCELAGIAGVARTRVGRYSLGMAQRLGIAAALLGDPAVVLLDEPFNGLDADGVRWVRGLLRRLADEDRTVLVSSHLLAEMQQTADHVIVIGRGRLLADCPTSELAGAAADTVVVEVPDPTDEDRLRAALMRQGVAVTGDAGVLRACTSDVRLVGDCAHAAGIRLHLLARESRTLEDGYLRLVDDQVEFQAVSA